MFALRKVMSLNGAILSPLLFSSVNEMIQSNLVRLVKVLFQGAITISATPPALREHEPNVTTSARPSRQIQSERKASSVTAPGRPVHG